MFQPNRNSHHEMQLTGIGRNRAKILRRLTELADQKKVTITYNLSSEYVWISYDEKTVNNIETPKINNRVFAIDMNPKLYRLVYS